MREVKRTVISLLICFGLLIALFLLQVFINTIPRDSIKENIIKSCDEYNNLRDFRKTVISDFAMATDDVIADMNLLSVVYGIDSETPLISTIQAKMYQPDRACPQQFLLRTQIEDDLPCDTNYSRYWHGVTLFLRPMLTVFSLKECKIVLSIILILIYTFALLRTFQQDKLLGTLLIISLLLGGIWSVPLSIEYFSVYILMGLEILWLTYKPPSVTLFCAIGMLTAFFDFLTAETLTFTIPILIVLYKAAKERKAVKWKDYFIYGAGWAIAYLETFFVRVIMVQQTCGSELLYSRFTGLFWGEKICPFYGTQTTSSVLTNLGTVIGGEKLPATVIVIIVLLICIATSLLLIGDRKIHGFDNLKIMLLTGIIPFVRYVILNKHSYYHHCFTYRALTATIFTIAACSLLISRKEKT